MEDAKQIDNDEFPFRDLDDQINDKTKLNQILDEAIAELEKYDQLKAQTSDQWEKCELLKEQLQREMLRQGVRSFRSLTSNANVFIGKKTNATFDKAREDAVIEWLRKNEGGGVVTTYVRQDSLGKFLNEFVERGGNIPSYIKIKPFEYLGIRRS